MKNDSLTKIKGMNRIDECVYVEKKKRENEKERLKERDINAQTENNKKSSD